MARMPARSSLARGDGADVHPGNGSGRIIASAAAEWPRPMACPRLCVSASWKHPRCDRNVSAPALLFKTMLPCTIFEKATPPTTRKDGRHISAAESDNRARVADLAARIVEADRDAPVTLERREAACGAAEAAHQLQGHARRVPLRDRSVELPESTAHAGGGAE